MGLRKWWGRARWSLYAPVYDLLARPFEKGRRKAVESLGLEPGDRVLILGCGTGSDLKYLPSNVSVTAIDTSPEMVRRTSRKADELDIDAEVEVGDAQDLDFEEDNFDAVMLHLILSVVPSPEAVVRESARVLTSEGRVSIYDKYIEESEKPSTVRRFLNPVARLLFADLNRELLSIIEDAGFEHEPVDSFLGDIYRVAIARPVER